MNNCRKLLVVLGAGALAAPLGSFAQKLGKVGRIGYLSPYPSGNDSQFEVFKQQLRDLGHVEGKTITIDYVSAEGKNDRLPALAAELVRRNVDVIMAAGGTPPVIAAKNATQTIPVVFAGVSDPVGQGIVASACAARGQCHWRHHPEPGYGRQVTCALEGSRAVRQAHRHFVEPDEFSVSPGAQRNAGCSEDAASGNYRGQCGGAH